MLDCDCLLDLDSFLCLFDSLDRDLDLRLEVEVDVDNDGDIDRDLALLGDLERDLFRLDLLSGDLDLEREFDRDDDLESDLCLLWRDQPPLTRCLLLYRSLFEDLLSESWCPEFLCPLEPLSEFQSARKFTENAFLGFLKT